MADDARGTRIRLLILQMLIEILGHVGRRVDAAVLLRELVVRERLYDLVWMDVCSCLAGLRDLPDWPELRAAVEARAAPVRDALLSPLA